MASCYVVTLTGGAQLQQNTTDGGSVVGEVQQILGDLLSRAEGKGTAASFNGASSGNGCGGGVSQQLDQSTFDEVLRDLVALLK